MHQLMGPNGVPHLICPTPAGRFRCATCGKPESEHDGWEEIPYQATGSSD